MKKATYMKPKLRLVSLEQTAPLMAASGGNFQSPLNLGTIESFSNGPSLV